MGMKNYSNSGHTVLASDLTLHLPEDERRDYLQAIEDGDVELVSEILISLPDSFPVFEDVFNVNFDDIETEDLEEGMYVCFNEADLFVKVENEAMKAIKALGITPTFSQWVTYS